MPLTKSDRRFHAPIPDIIDYLCREIPDNASVLEIGPGIAPFPRADVFVDILDRPDIKPDRMVKCDVCAEPLPFADKSFDFVYARHVLEDLWNPFLLCSEMSRVGKMGYIETPSPVAEFTRGVDGDGSKDPVYRGYHHHRWIIWRRGSELVFIPKFPLIEHFDITEQLFENALRIGPTYWNTYYPWMGSVKVRHLQNPHDYEFRAEAQLSIINVLNGSINESMLATNETLGASLKAA
jgi:Methyltransferase domain